MTDNEGGDDDELADALYEDGHWEWCERIQQLKFVSHLPVIEDIIENVPVVFGPIEFRDDLDVVEQLRFKRRFQRKSRGENDVVLVQDIKDVVLYTAPTSIVLPSIVKILHLSTTERFLRALILYSQYYLQISDEMTKRIAEQETKVRTNNSLELEMIFRDNLEDLRLLVAKEYSTMLIGGDDFCKYHHMGPLKKTRSLLHKDAYQFEAILRICIQIVWIALGRKSFTQIECEIHRMFKSEMFNMVEHQSHADPALKMSLQKRCVLLGHCAQKQTKLNTQSPLMKEIFCHRRIDFRLLGLGTIVNPNLTHRQRYLEAVLTANETMFRQLQVTLGIVGLPRLQFDLLLKEIKVFTGGASSTSNVRSRMSRASMKKSAASVGKVSTIKSTGSAFFRLYPNIIIPPKRNEVEWQPEEFPCQSFPPLWCSRVQRRKWLNRAVRLHCKRLTRKKSSLAPVY